MSEKIKYNLLASGEIEPIIINSNFYVDQNADIDYLQKQINLNYVTPRFRIYVLYQD